ncbi:uncharacterized protein DUF2690 [Streptomyces sp. 846.5]|nr:XRE family transcriptional regulator [Streptomyces sp. 846.5]TDT97780.1 uncharacterized protein DUF2690 [Streptomyces sp. 846.5]
MTNSAAGGAGSAGAQGVDPGTAVGAAPGPVTAFAADLRALREQAGSPSFRHLARTAHFSVSTMADATAGKRLPTEQVVRGFAAACGADPGLWTDRLREAAAQARAGAAVPGELVAERAAEPVPAGTVRTGAATRRWAMLAAVAAVVFAAGYAVSVALSGGDPARAAAAAGSGSTPAATPSTAQPFADGASPITAGCTRDAQLLDKTPLMLNGVQVGALELKYSAYCGAGWARAYLYPAGVVAGLAAPTGRVATVSVAAGDGTSSSYAQALDHQVPEYTDAVRPHGGCLSASLVLARPSGAPLLATIGCDSAGTR